MDHHVTADKGPGNSLAPNTLRSNVLIASTSIIGIAYLIFSAVFIKEGVGRAHGPHPRHFGRDNTRMCPRWIRTAEVILTFFVVPFWPLAIPYYVFREVKSRYHERRELKEEEKQEREMEARREQESKFGSVTTQVDSMPLPNAYMEGWSEQVHEADGLGQEIVIVSEGPDGQPRMRVFREVV